MIVRKQLQGNPLITGTEPAGNGYQRDRAGSAFRKVEPYACLLYTSQEEIPFDTVTVSNDMEYTVFSNVVNEGADGVQDVYKRQPYACPQTDSALPFRSRLYDREYRRLGRQQYRPPHEMPCRK